MRGAPLLFSGFGVDKARLSRHNTATMVGRSDIPLVEDSDEHKSDALAFYEGMRR